MSHGLDGIGWRTVGDALLAQTARQQALNAREEARWVRSVRLLSSGGRGWAVRGRGGQRSDIMCGHSGAMNSRMGAFGDGRVIVVVVPSMNCRHDVRTVSAALADVQGVVALQADLDTKVIRIEGDVSAGAVRAAITATGYGVR